MLTRSATFVPRGFLYAVLAAAGENLRALLAGLPLHRILSIDRPPFVARMLRGPMPPQTGDSVEIGEEEGGSDSTVWEVRPRDWGTGRADLTFNRAPRWDNVAC